MLLSKEFFKKYVLKKMYENDDEKIELLQEIIRDIKKKLGRPRKFGV